MTVKLRKKGITASSLHKKNMKNRAYRREYNDSGPMHELVREFISLRIKNEMSQSELAKKAGMKQQEISRIESGQDTVQISTLNKVARALGGKLKVHVEMSGPPVIRERRTTYGKKQGRPLGT